MAPAFDDDIFIAGSGVVSRTAKRLRGRGAGRHSDHASLGGQGRLLERRAAETAEDDRQKAERVAMARRSLQMVFQPIVDLHNGTAVGVEALARFTSPPVRSADQWFAEAAEVGLGTDLEMDALCAALEQLDRLPRGLYLSLNASPATMMSDTFRSAMAGANAERVVLELTEHTGVDDYQLLCGSIAQMRSNGMRLAVDDAGAGFSSLRHILNVQPDIIKLDVGLTRGIDRDPARRALGSALLTFGLDAFNASLVAEGVETRRELSTLQALGYPYAQGYYLGRPAQMTHMRLPSYSFEAVSPAEPMTDDDADPTSAQVAGRNSLHGRLRRTA